jgi:hypothetical protein
MLRKETMKRNSRVVFHDSLLSGLEFKRDVRNVGILPQMMPRPRQKTKTHAPPVFIFLISPANATPYVCMFVRGGEKKQDLIKEIAPQL